MQSDGLAIILAVLVLSVIVCTASYLFGGPIDIGFVLFQWAIIAVLIGLLYLVDKAGSRK